MSEIKKSKPKTIPSEPKPRGRKPKKQPTKDECLKMLLTEMDELKGEIQNLKEDQAKLPSGQFKVLPDLLHDEIEDMEEELKEIQEKYNELSKMDTITE